MHGNVTIGGIFELDAQAFWAVIGTYNTQTISAQVILLAVLAVALTLSYTGVVKWSAKLALGVANLYIGFVFFGAFGTQSIQKFFALPLYLCCGGLFIFESINNREDRLNRPGIWQAILLLLFVLYPVVSLLLGNVFPRMVTHIMPCPVVSLSIAVYSGYQKKNKLLLALLAVWGLTGVKSILFHAYEDLILLMCGVYCTYLFIKEVKQTRR